jgi:5,10-methylenetetrahydromethanopterin reductase
VLTGIPPAEHRDWKDSAMIVSGTVVRVGEDHTSARLVEAAGPWFGTAFHAAWELFPDALDAMPGGALWRERMLAARPEHERHLAVHEGHVTIMTDRDREAVHAAGPAILQSGWTGDATSVAARVEDVAAAGVGEIIYTAAGPDIPGELEAFAVAVSR